MHLEENCEQCGRSNIVWYVDSDRWNLATDGNTDKGRSVILCPSCFVELWQEVTYMHATWHLVPEHITGG